MIRKLVNLLLVTLCSLAFIPSASADRATDREEINALMWHYARALDSLNADAYAALFTEDGQFGTGENAAKGQDGLRNLITGVVESRKQREAESGEPSPQLYHMTTDSWIEFIDDTHARHHSYWLTMFGSVKPGEPPQVGGVGRGIDDVVKVNGRWLIKQRNVAPAD